MAVEYRKRRMTRIGKHQGMGMGRCDRVTSQSWDLNTRKWECEWADRMDGPEVGLKHQGMGMGMRVGMEMGIRRWDGPELGGKTPRQDGRRYKSTRCLTFTRHQGAASVNVSSGN
jgi:hypothetical protein